MDVERVVLPSLDYVEVRILAPLWIGPALFQAGDKPRMLRSDAEALNSGGSAPRVEIL
jgi:hypothetical protein